MVPIMLPGWDNLSPDSWAQRLGLVSVPLFGPQRQRAHPGQHAIILDGKASFAFCRGERHRDWDYDIVSSWAWSANVLHAVAIDEHDQSLSVWRWDDPKNVELQPLPDENSAENLIERFGNSNQPTSQTVIDKSLIVFRNIRDEIENLGGEEWDVVRSFNCLLAWADVQQRGKRGTVEVDGIAATSLGDIAAFLSRNKILNYGRGDFSASILRFPLGPYLEELADENGSSLKLDIDILIRHASGVVFQEAHIQLAKRTVRQARLVHIPQRRPPKPIGTAKRDAHFTPPSLARLLVQEALDESKRINGSTGAISALDPACGSGVFLIESIRETIEQPISLALRGFDSSAAACLMSEFGVAHISTDHSRGEVEYAVTKENSLSPETSWGSPDMILMNPPFTSWKSMNQGDRELVQASLGPVYMGRADTALAFVARAIEHLEPGAVVASVVPASFLESKWASKLRAAIYSDETLCVRLIGRFRGYRFFREALVETAFIVISRLYDASQRLGSIVVALAEDGHEDELIRALRKSQEAPGLSGDGWEILFEPKSFLASDKWTPRPHRAITAVARMIDNKMPVVTDLFDAKLGIRTGDNPTFILSKQELARFASTKKQRDIFRPIADRIRRGLIVENQNVFYPYGKDGKPLFSSDKDLASFLPEFYTSRLLPRRPKLSDRKSLRTRRWWELVEPRPTWIPLNQPKIISMTFSRRGSFAFDEAGKYAVVQGQGWTWKHGDFSGTDLPWAYLALFNSHEFESLLDLFCPRTQGGQYEVAHRFLSHVPLPDLSKCTKVILAQLANIGRSITQGVFTSTDELSVAVCAVYGLTPDEFRRVFPPSETARLERQFRSLAEEWKRETGYLSRASQRAAHPAYRQIIEMGDFVVPLILEDLKQSHEHWFLALMELTGENPVEKSDAGFVDRMANAWIQWAAEQGYDS